MKLDQTTQIAPGRVIPVSVTMIVKNCAENLRRCLASVKKHFLRTCDEIVIVDTGSTDNTPQVAEEFGARVILRPDLSVDVTSLIESWLPEHRERFAKDPQLSNGFLLDFAAARQIATDAAANDVQFWLDSDDVFEEEVSGTLRELINRHIEGVDGIFLNYVYSFDKEDGRPTSVLKRERVINRKKGFWKGKCHETFIPKDGQPPKGYAWFGDYNGAIIHVGGRADHTFGDIRNYIILRKELADDARAGREPDLRSIFYLANACRGLKKFDECVPLYERIMKESGSRDDRYAAAYYVATGYMTPEIARPIDALDYFYRAIKINPTDPRAYFGLQRCYYLLQRYTESVAFYRMGLTLPEPKESLHCYDPEHIHTLPHQCAAMTAIEMEDVALAESAVKALEARRPNHPDTKKIAEHVRDWYAGVRLAESVQIVAGNTRPATQLEYGNRIRQVLSMLPAVPPALEKAGLGRPEPADDRPERPDLVIYCGPTAEEWGPKNRVTGIGGSEKAVLEMSKRLQARGFNVTVYAAVPPNQRGLEKETGVLWRHFSEFDYTRPRGTVIFWRNPGGVLAPIPCLRRIVWCHDVQDPAAWTDAIIGTVDEVWVLSEYHASTLGDEVRRKLGSKLVITRNGIDPDAFAVHDGVARQPKKVIYCSSPDRGVITAIQGFQAAFPLESDAELHLYYGFTRHYFSVAARYEFSHFFDLNRTANYYEYAQAVAKLADSDPRIHWHGRRGPAELARDMSTADVWLYPTRFHEISCMAAMEAQAAGCLIVATDTAALEETIDWSSPLAYKIDQLAPEAIGETLRRAVRAGHTTTQRQMLARAARERFSYETLADEWAARLKTK